MEAKLGQSKETLQIENKGKWYKADSGGLNGSAGRNLDCGVGLLQVAVTALELAVSALLCTSNPFQLIPPVARLLLQLLHSSCHSVSSDCLTAHNTCSMGPRSLSADFHDKSQKQQM